MSKYTEEQKRRRAFDRAAWVLRHYWEEQLDDIKHEARVHSRLFDPLVSDHYIFAGTSKRGGGHREHLVPCAYLRNQAFAMYWANKTEEDVAAMLERFLRIANIHPEEARRLDKEIPGLKQGMPSGWNIETGDVLDRLTMAGIELEFSV